MGDALMNWEAGRSRWRKKYRGKWLQISAAELGGTNATDTKVAANQWLTQQKTQRDKELAITTYRPHEREYYAELESIQSDIKTLSALMRSKPTLQSMLAPMVENLKQKGTLINQALRQPVLPPLDDKLRNPLGVSPESIDIAAVREVEQQIADRLRGRTQGPFDYLFLRSLPDVEGQNTAVSFISTVHNDPPTYCTATGGNSEPSLYDERVQAVAETVAGLKDGVVARMKRELGLIGSEYERGQINQMLKEHGATVPENKQLEYHVGRFIEYQHRRHAEGKIGATRLDKIIRTLKPYREWCVEVNVVNVDMVGTKEHIDAYYKVVGDLKIAGKIGAEYANHLLSIVKMLIEWLVDEEILKEYPVCLQRKKSRYSFPIEPPKPEGIPLKWVHEILNAANPRLQLCILLTLNCGFGAGEIGQIRKSEYDPTTGRITRKRSKTRKSPTTPTVCYKLWDVTKKLLDQEIANCKKYPKYSGTDCLLVNKNGSPLWYASVTDGKPRTNSTISNAFKKLRAKLREIYPDMPTNINYYDFRGTSASLIYNEPKYRIYNELWLAHSPRSVAERHYNAVGDTILDDCLAWLYDRIFGMEQ